ncbi:tripartite tricarboxylate transporter TctB family protein [Desulfosporosinus shakirovi]|uniref:tripartite tricarboxylate transporter TctB family protein n=1 Tax=Desulfosporosinus shakirovi TaxID=2885154 RepID=UPI001E52D0DD|nr:tripartite tricarboxylate transporter TctB family protein [Desulfosporosinus sp. SRJS8]MCB8815144.1 tripartite tricarboxylate transporter TctB family protein [Desulfosporosinus sp. SRJS8]
MRIANRIVSILIIAAGLFLSFQSSKFDYMVDGTPGPGFLPFWLGISIALVALIPAVKTFTKFASKLANPFQSGDFKNFLIVIGSATLVVIVTPVTGLLVALGLMVGVIAKLMGTQSWKTVIGLTVFTPVLLFGIFVKILSVPLPKGIFGF